MKAVEAQGYSKEKALEASGLDVSLEELKNATMAWKKAGSPINTKKLNEFASEYIKKYKLTGAYIVVDPASDDTRTRPYNVINETTIGKRKATTTYQIKEAEFTVKYITETVAKVDKETGETTMVEVQTPYHKETITVVDEETGETKTKEVEVPSVKVTAVGAVEGKSTKKDSALKLMKELIEANKKNYVIEIVKEISSGQKYAAYGQYTPSKSAKVGKFMFFVKE